jgi:hypothetical protein
MVVIRGLTLTTPPALQGQGAIPPIKFYVMKAIGFAIGKYTSRKTGNISDKLVVKFDNVTEQLLWCNLPEFAGKDTKECVDIIKADRDKYLSRVIVAESMSFPGSYQAQFSAVEIEKEF